ncbi:MAG TPA: hypothetical protein ENG97_00455 [Deltaproteobacteria bacterium]|nr:hypothetical protein [Deltaproteobacteria bacterium]
MMSSGILFYLLAFLLIGSSLMVVFSKDIYRASFWLIGFFLIFAGLLFTLHAPFLALAEIIIYSGAIGVMIIFAVMLTGKYAPLELNGYSFVGIIIAVVFVMELVLVIKQVPEFTNFAFAFVGGSNARAIGISLFSEYLLPFEIIAILLLVALFGAVVLTMKGRSR